ncbi:hypothetical protein CDAR_87091 [Caerostris darwini]|uniref:Uncharacterized protein n=1 Tax=Caerostris darwini TaxID=1538125 RepID=A0AAV4U819_9ARAC|nr:hypothetical protein CDAR_87091 [Caerostris darwini]
MCRPLVFCCMLFFLLLLKDVGNSSGTFIPQRLGESVQQLCANLQRRIRCLPNSCSSGQRTCSDDSQCSCSPTAIEVCCSTTEGSGCCVNVPLPLGIGR